MNNTAWFLKSAFVSLLGNKEINSLIDNFLLNESWTQLLSKQKAFRHKRCQPSAA